MSKQVGPHLAHLWCAYAQSDEAFPDYEAVAQAVTTEPKFHATATLVAARGGAEELGVLLYECVQLVQRKTVECWVVNAWRVSIPHSMGGGPSLSEMAVQLVQKLPVSGLTEGYPATVEDARAAIIRYMPPFPVDGVAVDGKECE